jgi:phenylalanyl-tRNA synthetase alpha chain
MQRTLTSLERARDLSIRDLTDPAAGPHGLQVLLDQVTAALAAACGCAVLVRRGDRVVTVGENYDLLGFSSDVVTRDARYTRYVSEGEMLRSHTSAIVPGVLRDLAELGPDAPSDVLFACPGICYRRDAIGRWHTGTPHQLDVWRLRRRGAGSGDRADDDRARRLDEGDLDELIATICRTVVPGRPWRCEPRVHPYTERGRQVDVDWSSTWVEVAECGLAHPDVLRRAGLGQEWSGLALGMGLDRLYMLTKSVPDIRLLRSADRRVASQMLDLEPYRAVSSMPAISRDLSVAVDSSDIAEDLGDRVRDALGDEADYVEEVSVLSSTPWAALPAPARERLGIAPEQVNLLVRVVLRALDRTLEDNEANDLRDRVYAAIHQGSAHMWAGAGRP